MSGLVIPWKQGSKNPIPCSRHDRNDVVVTIDGKRKEKCATELCDCLIEIFAAVFGVSAQDLRQRERSVGEVNRVRQIAMYVAHVVCRLSMAAVGEGFQRDRTTVLHACHLVEDMRDDAEFDRIVAMAERVALAALRSRSDV